MNGDAAWWMVEVNRVSQGMAGHRRLEQVPGQCDWPALCAEMSWRGGQCDAIGWLLQGQSQTSKAQRLLGRDVTLDRASS